MRAAALRRSCRGAGRRLLPTLPLGQPAAGRCRSDIAWAEEAPAVAEGLPRWPAGSKPVYITTPIFYVNGVPHVGHLYTALMGDAMARWYRDCRAAPTFLAVGTDEHGLKVQQAAETTGQPTEQYVNARSAAFRSLFDAAGVSYDRFVRTSEPDHGRTVDRIWRKLAAAGHLHRGEHAGWYCVADETFVPEAQVVLDASGKRVSGESGRPVEWACEDNYLFELRKQLPALRGWVDGTPKTADQIYQYLDSSGIDVTSGDEDGEGDENSGNSVASGWKRRVTPAGAAGWVEAALRADDPTAAAADGGSSGGAGVAAELSVSRPASRVTWGVSVPDEPDHTVYVWLDALSNYLTAAGYGAAAAEPQQQEMPLWPPDHQIVGKDILKFHSIYWPAFLAAAGVALPERLHVHAHWQAHDGAKMSKTSGNVVDPDQLVSTYGVDAVRYYLLRDGPQGSKDSHFDEDALVSRCNADLANTLGNLLTRAAAPKLCPEQAWPCFPDGPDLLMEDEGEGELKRLFDMQALIAELPTTVDTLMRQGRVGTATAQTMTLLAMANGQFQANAPWTDKTETVGGRRDRAVWCALEALRVSLLLLQPVIPDAATKGLDMIGIPPGPTHRQGPEPLLFGFVSPEEEQAGQFTRAFVNPGALFVRLEKTDPEPKAEAAAPFVLAPEIEEAIKAKGDEIRVKKNTKEDGVQEAVAELKELKAHYLAITGEDWDVKTGAKKQKKQKQPSI